RRFGHVVAETADAVGDLEQDVVQLRGLLRCHLRRGHVDADLGLTLFYVSVVPIHLLGRDDGPVGVAAGKDLGLPATVVEASDQISYLFLEGAVLGFVRERGHPRGGRLRRRRWCPGGIARGWMVRCARSQHGRGGGRAHEKAEHPTRHASWPPHRVATRGPTCRRCAVAIWSITAAPGCGAVYHIFLNVMREAPSG